VCAERPNGRAAKLTVRDEAARAVPVTESGSAIRFAVKAGTRYFLKPG